MNQDAKDEEGFEGLGVGCLGWPSLLSAPVTLTLALSRCRRVFGVEGIQSIATFGSRLCLTVALSPAKRERRNPTLSTSSAPRTLIYRLTSPPHRRKWQVISTKRIIGGLRAQSRLGIIYFSWHANRVARWRACKYYANIAQIRTEDVADQGRRLGRNRSVHDRAGKVSRRTEACSFQRES